MSLFVRLLFAVAIVFATQAAFAADIRVMISSGFHGAYSELGPAFERATGNHLITTRGPSMGIRRRRSRRGFRVARPPTS